MITNTTVLNESGIHPLEYNIVIRLDVAAEKSQGGIIIPEVTRERNSQAQMTGTLIATGPLAFRYEVENGFIPIIGDRVSFGRYAGAGITGKDGAEYRVMKDGDLLAVVDAGVSTIV